MKKLFLIFFLLLATEALQAQEDIDSGAQDSMEIVDDDETKKEFTGSNDTTAVEKKEFDSKEIEKLRADPNLNYKQPPTVAETLWDRFLMWLSELINDLFDGATRTNFGQWLLIAGGVALLVLLIMILLKVDAFRVFYSGADQGKLNQELFHENIHEMDFEKLIREAAEKGEYRLGVRLIFLYALKKLSDKQLIDWRAGKTNHDYVEELKTKDLKTGLNELSFYFDYAWYGGFTINQEVFQKVEGIFYSWKDKVN